MIYRNSYSRFADSYIAEYRGVVLEDVWHHVQGHLLFPLGCTCKDCQCNHWRQQVILTLNMVYYHQLKGNHVPPEKLYGTKLILDLPDDSYLVEHYQDSYPLWLIHKELKMRFDNKDFKTVDTLCWTMMEIAQANRLYLSELRTSITEAVRFILGEKPLKVGAQDYLCGEKAFGRMLNKYKSVVHFILALEHMRKEDERDSLIYEKAAAYPLDGPKQINRFLSLSLWFRKELLKLVRPNVKDPELFHEYELLTLPSWVTYEHISIPILPLEAKVQEIKNSIVHVNPAERWRERQAQKLLAEKEPSVG